MAQRNAVVAVCTMLVLSCSSNEANDRSDDAAFTPAPVALEGSRVEAVWVSGEDVFAVTSGAILHRRDDAWASMEKPMALTSVTGTGARDVWVGGESVVLRYAGVSWDMPIAIAGGRISAIGCAAENDVWLGGESIAASGARARATHLVHLEGVTVRSEDAGVGRVRALWAHPSAVWAVGERGVARRDASTKNEWAAVADDARSVWGSAPDDVWLGGDGSALRHWDGARLEGVATTPARAGAVLAIGGTGSGDVWAVGSHGTVVHWNGSSWTAVRTGVDVELRAIAVTENAVWIGGDDVLLSLRR